MAGPPDTARFEASFKKVPGTLSITSTHIAWVPTTPNAAHVQNQALARITTMLTSKPEAARISLQVRFKDNIPEGGLSFTFEGAKKKEDRQAVQDMLVPVIAANRAAESSSGPGTPSGSTPATGTPGTPASLVRKRKADDGDSKARRKTNALREAVLRKNSTLKLLHRELVMAKQISEDEFWDGREALLKAEEMAAAQRPGRASRLLDDRFDLSGEKKDDRIQGGTGVGKKKVADGPVVVALTKDLVREIFEEFPVVQHAYAKYVPGIDEKDFWARYFTSRLWEQHRASVRKNTRDDSAWKPDDIFDQYLEDPDWEVAPKKALPDNIEKYLDLAATEEDHGESTIRDVTMQAGKERAALPLIRRFNDHSEKLLQAGRKGSTPMVVDDLDEQIEFEDLRAPQAPAVIPLHVDSKDDSEKGPPGILKDKTEDQLLAMSSVEAARVSTWNMDFSQVCLANPANPTNPSPNPATQEMYAFQRDAQAVASRVVRDMHVASNAEDAIHQPLPETILNQMRSCHNAAAEFLRQFWAAILPPPPGALGGPAHTPAARAARAAKMAKYLEGTESKVNAIVTTAEVARVDPDRVRAAMAPTLGAVAVALRREKARSVVV